VKLLGPGAIAIAGRAADTVCDHVGVHTKSISNNMFRRERSRLCPMDMKSSQSECPLRATTSVDKGRGSRLTQRLSSPGPRALRAGPKVCLKPDVMRHGSFVDLKHHTACCPLELRPCAFCSIFLTPSGTETAIVLSNSFVLGEGVLIGEKFPVQKGLNKDAENYNNSSNDKDRDSSRGRRNCPE